MSPSMARAPASAPARTRRILAFFFFWWFLARACGATDCGFTGGFAVRKPADNCTSADAPVFCGGGEEPRCCPEGFTCFTSDNPGTYCCPTDEDCLQDIQDVPRCTNSSWTMWDTPRLLHGGVWCCDSDNFGVTVSPYSNNGGGVGCTPFGSPLASYEATAFVATNLATSCTTVYAVAGPNGISMTTTSTKIVQAGATYSGSAISVNATGTAVITTTAAPAAAVSSTTAAGTSPTGSATGAALSPATIAGIAVGAVMAVVVLVLAIFVSIWCAKRRRLARNPPGPRELDGADHGRLPMGHHPPGEADSNAVHELDAGVFNDMSHEGDKTNLFPEKAVILEREKELQDIKEGEGDIKGVDDYRDVYA